MNKKKPHYVLFKPNASSEAFLLLDTVRYVSILNSR
nr:MAG TPA: hypothetical protein [Caudoviricetes sp.]